MTHLTFTENGKTYRQITKRTAKRLYCEGKTIIAAPANIHPFNIYGVCVLNFSRERDNDFILDDIGAENRFEELCNSAIYYNCNNETGRYLRFYAEF